MQTFQSAYRGFFFLTQAILQQQDCVFLLNEIPSLESLTQERI